MTVNRAKTVTMTLTPVDVEDAIVEWCKRQDRSVKGASSADVLFAEINNPDDLAASELISSVRVTLTVPMKDKATATA